MLKLDDSQYIFEGEYENNRYRTISDTLNEIFPKLRITLSVAKGYQFSTVIGVGAKPINTNIKMNFDNNHITTINNVKSILKNPIAITNIRHNIVYTNRSANIVVFVGESFFKSKQITTDMIIAGCIHEIGHWVHLDPITVHKPSKIILNGIQLISVIGSIGIIITATSIVGPILHVIAIEILIRSIVGYWFQKTELMCDTLVSNLGRGGDLKMLLSKITVNKKHYNPYLENKLEIYINSIIGFILGRHPTLQARFKNIDANVLNFNSKRIQFKLPEMLKDIRKLYTNYRWG